MPHTAPSSLQQASRHFMSRIVKTPKRGKKTPQLGSLKRLSDPSKMRPSRLRKPVPRRNKALQEEDSRESVAVSLDRTTFANMPGEPLAAVRSQERNRSLSLWKRGQKTHKSSPIFTRLCGNLNGKNAGLCWTTLIIRYNYKRNHKNIPA